MRINFDMDGTIADLYGVDNWLEYLINGETYPYTNAKPLVRLSALAKRLNNLQKRGIELGVISWLAKNSTEEYDNRVTQAKREWLEKHLPSIKWDKVVIVAYGTPKENYCETEDDILFDDETKNRENWTGKAYNVNNILEVLATC